MEFHTEDYVRFLSHINPGIADDYKDQMSRCRKFDEKENPSCYFQ